MVKFFRIVVSGLVFDLVYTIGGLLKMQAKEKKAGQPENNLKCDVGTESMHNKPKIRRFHLQRNDVR